MRTQGYLICGRRGQVCPAEKHFIFISYPMILWKNLVCSRKKTHLDEPNVILVKNNSSYYCGDKMDIEFGGISHKLTISVILTDNSYIPSLTSVDNTSDIIRIFTTHITTAML